jgi:hypothetical protein
MHSARGHCHHARAEMPGAGDIIWRVTDDDELFRLKLDIQMFVNSLSS